MNSTQIKRYAKAVELVENRTDLNTAQTEAYLDRLERDKSDINTHAKPDSGYGSTIIIYARDGRVIRAGEEYCLDSIESRLICVCIDNGLATPILDGNDEVTRWEIYDHVKTFKVTWNYRNES